VTPSPAGVTTLASRPTADPRSRPRSRAAEFEEVEVEDRSTAEASRICRNELPHGCNLAGRAASGSDTGAARPRQTHRVARHGAVHVLPLPLSGGALIVRPTADGRRGVERGV